MGWRIVVLFALVGCRFHFDRDDGRDAASDGADVDAGVCAQPSTILCEDFTTNPTVPMDGDVQWFPSGGHAGGWLRVASSTGSGAHWTLPPTSSGSLNARVYLRIEPGTPIQMFFVMVELNNAVATNGTEKVSADITTNDVWSIGAPFSGGAVSTVTSLRDVWTCVELRVVVDSTAGEMRLLVDGTEAKALTMRNTLIPMGFHELILSATVSATDPAATVDFDDLVVSRAPIGC